MQSIKVNHGERKLSMSPTFELLLILMSVMLIFSVPSPMALTLAVTGSNNTVNPVDEVLVRNFSWLNEGNRDEYK